MSAKLEPPRVQNEPPFIERNVRTPDGVEAAVALLARQACACLPETGRIKVVCLRCELLTLLAPDSALISKRPNRRKGSE
jgi:hypothetical protein